MKKIITIILTITILGIATYFLFIKTNQETTTNEPLKTNIEEENNTTIEKKETMTYQFKGTLDDVTLGKIVREINTNNKATGIAQANFENNQYKLLVNFENLPEPTGSDFYEGWIVKKEGEFSVLSTGKVEKKNGTYQNYYESNQDLTDHDFYVLTIEPNDGDPAPAEHILEGTIYKLKQ